MKRFLLVLTGCAALLSTACDGGGGGNGQPDGGGGDGGSSQPTTVTVSGKVLDADGRPLANATVLVLGKTSVTSDASGAFSVPDVTAPYDIAAVRGDKQAAIVYKGVTRKDPTLSIYLEESSSGGPAYSGKITGTVTGAKAPSATVSTPDVVFAAASGPVTSSSFEESDSSFSADVSWDEGTSLSGSLVVLQGERASASGNITRYTGFGRRDNVTLGNGATLANQGITLGPVTSANISGKVSVPSGFALFINGVNMQLSPGVDVSVAGQPGGSPDFNYAVPVVPQTSFSLLAVAFSGAGATSIGTKVGLAAGATNANLDLKAPPTPQLPADKATGVTRSTEFSWSSVPGGVTRTTFAKKLASTSAALATETPFSLSVFTSDARATLPDLSALGMALPANTDFTWRTYSISPIASVDAILVPLSNERLPSGLNEIYAGLSASREFKTAATP